MLKSYDRFRVFGVRGSSLKSWNFPLNTRKGSLLSAAHEKDPVNMAGWSGLSTTMTNTGQQYPRQNDKLGSYAALCPRLGLIRRNEQNSTLHEQPLPQS